MLRLRPLHSPPQKPPLLLVSCVSLQSYFMNIKAHRSMIFHRHYTGGGTQNAMFCICRFSWLIFPGVLFLPLRFFPPSCLYMLRAVMGWNHDHLCSPAGLWLVACPALYWLQVTELLRLSHSLSRKGPNSSQVLLRDVVLEMIRETLMARVDIIPT